MTSKSRGMWLMLLAGILIAGTVMVATASQKAAQAPPAPAAPPAPPAVAAGQGVGVGQGVAVAAPEPDEEFIFIEDGRAWLGVTLTDVSADKARELKLAGEYGAVVESVSEESPAAKAGLEKGDVITGFGGERVRSVAQLRRLVRETPAGRKLSLEVVRGGQTRTMEVTLEARRMRFFEPEIAVAPRIQVAPRVEIQPMPRFELEMPGPNIMTWSRGPRLGVTTDDVSGQLAEHFGVKQGQGVLVKEVMEGSAAAKAGLKAGDVIIRLNDETINEVGDLRKALNEAESREVTVTVVRDRREQSFQVTLDESQPRRPRRTAEAGQEIEQRAQQMAQEVRRRAAEMEDQMRDRVEAQLHRQQEVLQRSQERIQQREQELRQRRQLQEFQEKMREQERLYRELQYEREVI